MRNGEEWRKFAKKEVGRGPLTLAPKTALIRLQDMRVFPCVGMPDVMLLVALFTCWVYFWKTIDGSKIITEDER